MIYIKKYAVKLYKKIIFFEKKVKKGIDKEEVIIYKTHHRPREVELSGGVAAGAARL